MVLDIGYPQVPVNSEMKALLKFIYNAFGGSMNLRTIGKFGRDVMVIESGDSQKPTTMGVATRSRIHRDYDDDRNTSLAVITFLQPDVFGVMLNKDKEFIIHANAGDMILMPTSVFHFGASHEDFCGKPLSTFRRRIFSYWDVGASVSDQEGLVTVEDIPDDYTCCVQDAKSLAQAFRVITHPLETDRGM